MTGPASVVSASTNVCVDASRVTLICVVSMRICRDVYVGPRDYGYDADGLGLEIWICHAWISLIEIGIWIWSNVYVGGRDFCLYYGYDFFYGCSFSF